MLRPCQGWKTTPLPSQHCELSATAFLHPVAKAIGIEQMHRATGVAQTSVAQPPNRAIESIGEGIEQAVRHYATHFAKDLSHLCFVTLKEEGGGYNFADQRMVQIEPGLGNGTHVGNFRGKLNEIFPVASRLQTLF